MAQYSISLNKNVCIECHTCMDSCTENVFELDEEDRVIVSNIENCNGCGECESMCSTMSISVRESYEAISRRRENSRKIRSQKDEKLQKLMSQYPKDENNYHSIPKQKVFEIIGVKNDDDFFSWILDDSVIQGYTTGDNVDLILVKDMDLE
jgi:formate hydrogenlyase subunit 6/NADH:ubiquinone oxidoreductase subunit I